VLAAGAGTRLRPLTLLRPKVLCPVGNVPLVDLAIARVAPATSSIAVNVHHGRELLESHLSGRVHLSIEDERALGTAGALGRLRDWIGGRPVLVVNGDSWTPVDLRGIADGWDGERIRVLVAGGPFRTGSPLAAALMPWSDVAELDEEPSGLYQRSWRPAMEAGRVESVVLDAPFFDCGTPASYLAANLTSSGGASVVGPGAVVDGTLERCVVWPGAIVRRGERLVDAIRAGDRMTVLVR